MDINEDFQRLLEQAKLELHPQSPMPIYYQLSRIFIKLIQDEIFLPGSRFPSEEAIASHFKVSRPTANKAVHILLSEEWLARDKQDKRSGTFVKEKPYFSLGFLNEGLSFADQFPEGVPIKSQTIWLKRIPATAKVARELHLQEGDPIFHLRRLRFAFRHPIMVCDSRLSEARFPDFDKSKLLQDSLYTALEERYNCPIMSSERHAMAVEAVDPEIVRLLGVQPFSSIMMITGVSYTLNNEPIDYLQTYLQPGASLKNVLHRRKE